MTLEQLNTLKAIRSEFQHKHRLRRRYFSPDSARNEADAETRLKALRRVEKQITALTAAIELLEKK